MSNLKTMFLLAIDLEATVADARPIAELALASDAEVELLHVVAPAIGSFGLSRVGGRSR